jgi:hypothetical protein
LGVFERKVGTVIKKVVRRRPLVTKKAKNPVWSEKGAKPRAVKPPFGKVRVVDEFELPTQNVDVMDMTREQLLEMALLPFALEMDFYEWHSSEEKMNDALTRYTHFTGASNILLARAILGARTDRELKHVRVFAKKFGQNEVNDDNINYTIIRQVIKVCPDAVGGTIKEKLDGRPTPSDCDDCVSRENCPARKAL